MLTALSVGRECGLVGRHEQVITIKARKNPDGIKPFIHFEATGSPKVFSVIKYMLASISYVYNI